MGLNNPYDGVDAQSHHPSEMKAFPGTTNSRISVVPDQIKTLHGDSLASCDVSFAEPFQFNKVLQGQETVLNQSYGRGPATGMVLENSGASIINGVQIPGHGNRWSHIQGYPTHIQLPTPSGQVSSPSSVMMFHQASFPVSKVDVTTCGGNLEKLNASNPSSERYVRWISSCSSSKSGCRRGDLIGHGSDILKEHKNVGIPHTAFSNVSSRRTGQSAASTCKNSCRLFGFSLAEGKNGTIEEDNQNQATTSYDREASFVPQDDVQLQPMPPLVTKVSGNGCTKTSDLYAVRDMLLDIAL